MTEITKNAVKEWIDRISGAWQESVIAILETGRLIEQAKNALPDGDFASMVAANLPFSRSTAYKLIAISRDPKLSRNVRILPPHWGTLNELTKLTDEQFKDAVDDGIIHPEMQRGDIATTVKQAKRAEKERKLGGVQLDLPAEKFGVIVADPEWKFEVWSAKGMDRSADNHYPTSVLEVIKARDVPSIAAEDCILFLWATSPMARHAFAVMEAWGFDYRSQVVWAKDRVGTGYWFRNAHETLLVGVKGNIPCPAPGTQYPSLMEGRVTKHSAKPEAFLEMIEQYFPTIPKIELNRRGPARKGWAAWGLETDAGPPEAVTTASAAPASDSSTPQPPDAGAPLDLDIPESLRRRA